MESSFQTQNTALAEQQLRTKIYQASQSIPRRLQWTIFTITLVISDLLMLSIAFRAAYWIRFELNLDIFQLEIVPSMVYYRNVVLVVIPVWLVIFLLMGLYNRHNLLAGTQEYAIVFNAVALGFVGMIAAGFLFPEFIFARGWMIVAWFLSFFLTSLGRFIVRRGVYILRYQGYLMTPAVIVGANEESRILAEQLLLWKTSGLLILGFVDRKAPKDQPIYHNLKSLGSLDELSSIISKNDVGEVILTTSALRRDEMVSIFKQYGVSNNITLRLSSGLFEIITTGLQVTELASVPLVRINKARLAGLDRFLKLMLDYSIAIPGLILISPLLLVIAVAIKLDSPGPVIHRRRVMGVNGEMFDAFKFRTMRLNGDEILAQHPELKAELAENHKLIKDPRITRFGNFLRRSSLDELPQLVNVIKREMSLVGPRMITQAEISKYHKFDMNLLTVQPGITGLWQVSGRSDISYEERVKMDMHYVRNWSIWLDIQLLLATIPAVIKGRGAY
jgi:exopolysaccharide biosynthesis polyprenyl glycosylphosphotransferase